MLAAGLALASCSPTPSRSTASARSSASGAAGWSELSFDGDADQPQGQAALAYAPEGSVDWPVLVALHGRGEAGRGLMAGARGWRDDYDLDLVREKLEKGEITSELAKGFASPARLASLTASLAANPWKGLVMVTPYCPVPHSRSVPEALSFGRFIKTRLLSKVQEARRITRPQPASCGIDGVSMGGRYALQIGFSMPELFRTVGALQPAIQPDEAEAIADLALAAHTKSAQRIRLVSSEEDPFLEATRRLAEELGARKLAPELVVTSGPHDYIWNRGPGALELLMFHERALRGLPAP